MNSGDEISEDIPTLKILNTRPPVFGILRVRKSRVHRDCGITGR